MSYLLKYSWSTYIQCVSRCSRLGGSGLNHRDPSPSPHHKGGGKRKTGNASCGQVMWKERTQNGAQRRGHQACLHTNKVPITSQVERERGWNRKHTSFQERKQPLRDKQVFGSRGAGVGGSSLNTDLEQPKYSLFRKFLNDQKAKKNYL